MATIAVFNPRRGAGKTITAVHLLAAIGGRGQRPWGVDLDPGAHLSSLFDVAPGRVEESIAALFARNATLADVAHITRSGVVMCPGHPDLPALVGGLGKGLDVLTRVRHALRQPGAVTGPVVIDCPSSRDTLALNGMLACDLLIVPVSCDLAGVQGAAEAEKALAAFQSLIGFRLPRKYVLTKYDDSPIAAEAHERLRAVVGDDDMCATRIRVDPALAGGFTSLDVLRSANSSAEDYARLADELVTATGWPV
jgi:chromosome partitioning protein